jgi:type IV pilus assembly protein PilV
VTVASPSPWQQGFTLLEALVTIVIISIGLLGLLKLQSVALVDTQISAARSQATIAADNMADRIRANPAGALKGAYNDVEQSDSDSTSTSIDCLDGTVCTTAQMAAFDIREWKQTLSKTLPDGNGFINCSPDPDTGECHQYTITVAWHERKRGGKQKADDDTQCNSGEGVIERCFQTVVRP